jgi:hypothetical protein
MARLATRLACKQCRPGENELITLDVPSAPYTVGSEQWAGD